MDSASLLSRESTTLSFANPQKGHFMALMVQSSILRIRLHFVTWRHPETLSFGRLSESEERSLFLVEQIEIGTGRARPLRPTKGAYPRGKKNEAYSSIVWLANEDWLSPWKRG